jgi:hypothetical protein
MIQAASKKSLLSLLVTRLDVTTQYRSELRVQQPTVVQAFVEVPSLRV